MASVQEWIVCEQSGRWAAALRMSLARKPLTQPRPRLHETRSLREFAELLDNSTCHLALVEIRTENLNEALQLLTHNLPRRFRFAALLENLPLQRRFGDDLHETRLSSLPSLPDLLWEIGAVEVLHSPRQSERLTTLHSRLLANLGTDASSAAGPPALADWAWSAIPWQDA